MTTKIKTTLLTALFFFALLPGLQAQDKYDFGLVVPNLNGIIRVLINDAPTKDIDTGKKGSDIWGIYERQLSIVSKMTEEGWEVYNVQYTGVIYHYFLRKKKN